MKKFLIIAVIIVALIITYLIFGYGGMCGGMAGKICPKGYDCFGTNSYPDASGSCFLTDPLSK